MNSMKELYTQMQEEGYSDYEISIRMRSTNKEWSEYIKKRDMTDDEIYELESAQELYESYIDDL